MTEYRKPHGHDCDPTDNPADQPKPPSDGKECEETKPTPPPEWKDPEPCWTPDPRCKCPEEEKDPPPKCLTDLIAEQTASSVVAQRAEEFKKVLEDILAKAQAVRQQYTRDKYDELVKEWKAQDEEFARVIRTLVCDVPCWKCVLSCYVCPLINTIYVAQKSLYDDGELYTEVHDLRDLEYWHQRNKDAKQREFDRIKGILSAWETPGDSIADVLSKNKAQIEKIKGLIPTENGKAIFEMFVVLIPTHLAIAPPAGEGTTTRIDKKYTEFCKCEDEEPKDCCGPDVGPWILRVQSIQPKPYLIDPNDYFKLICCLVTKFYSPAKKALTEAEVGLADVTARIDAAKKAYEDGLKNFAANADAAIPKVIKCGEYEKDRDEDDDQQQEQRQRQSY
jgi:hypothetical protein